MKKIELEIVALSHSITQTHSYAVVLGEMNGLRRLPIVIGGFEAQAIAVALENMHPSRPLTHDLMKNFMNAFGVELQEIIINDLQEGIFYSKLVCYTDNDTVEIDSRNTVNRKGNHQHPVHFDSTGYDARFAGAYKKQSFGAKP